MDNLRVVLASRPTGWVTEQNFRVEKAPVPQPKDGEVLVKNEWLSLDPYMRGRMNDVKSYAAKQEIDAVMVGGTAGEVVESKNPKFKPGDKAVYVRNPKYVPRNEPPSGTAGGKQVYLDRVEWNLALRDPQAQVNALQKGEVDIIEALSFDFYDTVKKDAKLQMPRFDTIGRHYAARFNHLHKPFDNVKVRQAAMAAFAQEPFLRAQVGVKELYQLFPKGPAKTAAKIAGIPKPRGCI